MGWHCWWVSEVPRSGVMLSMAPRLNYLHTRTVQLQASTYSAYSVDARTNRVASSTTMTFNRSTSAPVRALPWVDGHRSVLVTAGPLGGHWLPMDSKTVLR